MSAIEKSPYLMDEKTTQYLRERGKRVVFHGAQAKVMTRDELMILLGHLDEELSIARMDLRDRRIMATI